LKAEEMNAINLLMQIHDEQLELVTVKDIERVNEIVTRELRSKHKRTMKETA
jgi:hypothetical protein